MACESGSGIVPRAGGDRGDVHDRRRYAIAASATEGAIALCALCLIGAQRSSPGPVPPAMRNRTPGGLPRLLFYCVDITGTAGTGRGASAVATALS